MPIPRQFLLWWPLLPSIAFALGLLLSIKHRRRDRFVAGLAIAGFACLLAGAIAPLLFSLIYPIGKNQYPSPFLISLGMPAKFVFILTQALGSNCLLFALFHRGDDPSPRSLGSPQSRPVGEGGEVAYAGFIRRGVAWLLDGVFVSAMGSLLSFATSFLISLGLGPSGKLLAMTAGVTIGIVVAWLYFAVMESSRLQATVGKLALRVRVVNLECSRISFGRATCRYLGHYISSIFLLGFLLQLRTPKRQAWHDLAAGCLVIKQARPGSSAKYDHLEESRFGEVHLDD